MIGNNIPTILHNTFMDERQRWEIIGNNLDQLVPVILATQKGAWVDVFTDETGSSISVSKPSGTANIKLCSVTGVTPADLDARYDLHPSGNDYLNGEGDKITREQFPAVLADYIRGAKDGGAEWGWEFKVTGD